MANKQAKKKMDVRKRQRYHVNYRTEKAFGIIGKLNSDDCMQDLEAMEGVDVIHGDHDRY